MILLSVMLLTSAPETASDLATVSTPVAMQSTDEVAKASPVVHQKSAAAPADQSTAKAVSETRAPRHKSGLKAILGVLGTILGSSLLL